MSEQDEATRTAASQTRTADSAAPSSVLPSNRIGRYLVESEIGRGGMGVVYRATDPDLERQLAIKVVSRPAHKSWPLSRLLAEARAMAKLRHPHVLPIFDVGTVGDAIYLVMPLAGGGTLRDWLMAEPRGWRDVVDRFVAAGRGLAAAHGAGLVHRDFKPHNVLVDADGQVLVADFGLVSEDPVELAGTAGAALESSIMGTPAYMAPEQADGRRVDARADQYSFCVAFWEGLRGRRPSEDATRERHEGVADDERSNDGSSPCPGWLLELIAVGLAKEPAHRWPSMTALLDKIEQRLASSTSAMAPSRRGRRLLFALVAATAVTVPTSVALYERGADPRPSAQVRDDAVAAGAPRQLATMGTCVRRPAFANDHRVVFEVLGATGTSLYTIGVDGSGLSPLTDATESVERPIRGRRDGELLAVARPRDDTHPSHPTLFDLYSSDRRTIATPNARGALAIDDALYYVDEDAGALVAFPGADAPTLKFSPGSLGGVSFAPATRTVAHVGVRGGPVCRRPLGRPESICSGNSYPVQTPAFTRDGGGVYVGDDDGVWRVDFSSREERRIVGAEAAGGVTLSPNGERIVWASCRRRALITDLAARPEIIVAEDLDVGEVVAGAGNNLLWTNNSPDGRQLVVRGPTSWVRISSANGDLRAPSLDPSGTRVACWVEEYEPGIHVYPLDQSGEPFQVSRDKGDRDPVWLDEKTILFHRLSEDGTYAVRMVRIDRNDASVQLRRGLRVLAVDVPGQTALVEIREAGGARLSWWEPKTDRFRPVAFTEPSTLQSAAISANGRWLMLQSGEHGELLSRASLPDGQLELVYKEDRGRSLGRATIRDDGHVLAAPLELHGELWTTELDTTRTGEASPTR